MSLPTYEIFALGAAVCFGANAVVVRIGMSTSNAATASLFSISVNVLVAGALVALTVPVREYLLPGLFFFVASGLLQPGIVRTLTYWSLGRIGVARTQPIRSATPLTSVALAIVFLGEQPTIFTLLGTLAVITGIVFISLEPRSFPATWRRRDLAIPIAATILAGISQLFRKSGLLLVPAPFLAVFVTGLTSWIITLSGVVLYSGLSRRHAGDRATLRLDRHSFIFFMAAAVTSSLGQIFSFVALSRGNLSIVSPLANTTPLFSVLFAAIFLRRIEQVTSRVVAGAIVIVLGIFLILR